MRQPSQIRILLGNEPRAYRQVLAGTFQALRPDAEVIGVEPADLDAEVLSRRPHLVVCSDLSEAVETLPLGWVLLHPDGADLAVVSIGGTQKTIMHVEFDDLLAAIDSTAALADAP